MSLSTSVGAFPGTHLPHGRVPPAVVLLVTICSGWTVQARSCFPERSCDSLRRRNASMVGGGSGDEGWGVGTACTARDYISVGLSLFYF